MRLKPLCLEVRVAWPDKGDLRLCRTWRGTVHCYRKFISDWIEEYFKVLIKLSSNQMKILKTYQ